MHWRTPRLESNGSDDRLGWTDLFSTPGAGLQVGLDPALQENTVRLKDSFLTPVNWTAICLP